MDMSTAAGSIRVGVGGWTFEPWRQTFYPPSLPHSRELHHMSRQLTAVEVNGTFYSTFGPSTFAKWRDETPDGFRFALKAHRSTTNRRELGTAGEAIERFLGSGVAELGDKLGPVLWQLMPTKKFDAADFEAFVRLLPRELAGRPLQHVLDLRHPTFEVPDALAITRRHGCVVVHTDSPKYPNIVDEQAPFAYLRLMRSEPERASGYPPEALDAWATGARAWSGRGRDAWVFFINGAKERAPGAAVEFLRRCALARQE
jgi:uncharacterized protein YecE (DUF72 family)